MAKIVRLTESELTRVIKESVEAILKEAEVDKFTPYKEGEGAKMFQASLKTSTAQRNPSYVQALKTQADKGNKVAIARLKEIGEI